MTRTRRLPLLVCAALAALAPSSAAANGRTSLADADTAFALDLYAKLRAGEGNLVFSPLSISVALGMTWAGAAGDTAAEMARALHFADVGDDAAVHEGFAGVVERLAKVKKVELRMANRLYGQKGYAFRKDFLKAVRRHYAADLEVVDFKKKAEAARKRINAWVAKVTKKKILDLIPAGGVDVTTRLVLVNAIYFKGKWEDPFEKDATVEEPFTTGAGAKVQTPMMHRGGAYRYAARDGAQVLELPFQGGQLALVVILPVAVDGLPALEARLTPKQLAAWLAALAPTESVLVALPRFRASGKAALKATLQALGVVRAFDEAQSDFSAMAEPGAEPLFVSDVHHQAWIAVTEEGAEAAAATGVVMGTGRGRAPPPVVFTADHPFIYLLRDTRDGHLLFLGRVVDPTAN